MLQIVVLTCECSWKCCPLPAFQMLFLDFKRKKKNPNFFGSAPHIWGGHYRGASLSYRQPIDLWENRWAGRWGREGGAQSGSVCSRGCSQKNDYKEQLCPVFFFFCKTENNRHAAKVPIAKKRQTWAAAHSPSSLVRDTMRDVATMWYYWV